MSDEPPLTVRQYGTEGPLVILVHGGPGAPGSLGSLARQLGPGLRVLEPWQRRSGAVPLTVARHVADLHQLIGAQALPTQPILLGSSWGAMLALAYAAEHPDVPRGLMLVGCGTFDARARAIFQATVQKRLTSDMRRQMAELSSPARSADERLAETARLLLPVYSQALQDPDTARADLGAADARGHDETWRDMLRLQKQGVYPAAFAAIRCPVRMIHGARDPHPGPATRDTLRHVVPHLEYEELARCGHFPWLEREAAAPLLASVRAWIRHCP